jgi:hypothetical protein
MSWSEERSEQHRGRFPPEERGERRREAQQRYRKRHRKQLAQARKVMGILLRQTSYHDDVTALAAALRDCLPADDIRALRRALMPTRK